MFALCGGGKRKRESFARRITYPQHHVEKRGESRLVRVRMGERREGKRKWFLISSPLVRKKKKRNRANDPN